MIVVPLLHLVPGGAMTMDQPPPISDDVGRRFTVDYAPNHEHELHENEVPPELAFAEMIARVRRVVSQDGTVRARILPLGPSVSNWTAARMEQNLHTFLRARALRDPYVMARGRHPDRALPLHLIIGNDGG